MNEIELSKLPKEIIIKILLQVNDVKHYNVRIHYDGYKKDYYVKAVNKSDVIGIISKIDAIKGEIIKCWKNWEYETGRVFYVREKGDKMRFTKRNNLSSRQGWIIIENTRLIEMATEHFDKMLKEYLDTGYSYAVSIKKIIMYS